ncbi:MAG: FtsQ-type POTRA domain-containing protein [Alphaproteobacteria bacterium]|nr:FtsQ-type POTRA domain-containing protein [Alphaproteobacteria bacterium]
MRQLSFDDRLLPDDDDDITPKPARSKRRKSARTARKPKEPERRSALRWALRRMRWPGRRIALRGGSAVLALCFGIYLAIGGNASQFVDSVGRGVASLGADVGFTVQNVFAEGRHAVPSRTVLDVLGVQRGSPLLAFDAEAARARLESLDWIKSATVERRLPDTIMVRIIERQPLALWQHEGRLVLIDREGASFGASDVARYGYLPLVVGEDAPREAPRLFDAMAAEPQLFKHVASAIWVGGRRWNVRFDSGLEARLPEGDITAAWVKLGALIEAKELLKRPVAAVDLRLGDRTVIRMRNDPIPDAKTDQGTT